MHKDGIYHGLINNNKNELNPDTYKIILPIGSEIDNKLSILLKKIIKGINKILTK